MDNNTSKQNPVVERARAARERTGHWPGSHAEALCNEVVRLHALVLEREGMLGRAASEISDLQQSARETTTEPRYPRCACGAHEWGPNTTRITDGNGQEHYREMCATQVKTTAEPAGDV